jgi:hypothetical protein
MALSMVKKGSETWREAAERYAKPYGLEEDVLGLYDAKMSQGYTDYDAAWEACEEWDVLDYTGR